MTKEKLMYRILNIIFVILFTIFVTHLCMVHTEPEKAAFSFDEKNIEELNSGWEVNYGGTIEDNVSLPIELPVEQGTSVILRRRLPDKIKQYNCILVESKRQDIVVSVGGIQRSKFTDKETRPYGTTTPSGMLFVPLYNTDSQSDLAIRISSDSSFSGEIGNVFLGTESSLIIMILKKNLPLLFLTAIVFIVGIVCAISYFMYRDSFEIGGALVYLAMFAVLASIRCFAQSGIRQIFFNNLALLEAIGYVCYTMLPIQILAYTNRITNSKYESVFRACVTATILNFIGEYILQAFFGIFFFDMRYITQAILILSIVVITIICFMEIRIEFGFMTKSLLVGIVGLTYGAMNGVSTNKIAFAWGTSNKFIVGAFIFLASGFIYVGTCISKEQNMRKDAESANLAKSLFLATMSHEIKTPINAVIGMNEMIMRDSKDDSILEYATNISEAGKTLLSIVNNVLDFSKIESGKMDIVCVNYNMKSVLRDLIKMTEMRIKDKDLKLVIDIDENIPSEYYGDEIRLKQIVSNLLTNATKYTPSGSITFTVKELSRHEDDVELLFSVKDTGVGIKSDDISRFMDSFVRVDQVKNSNIEGTGLGLTIASQLLKLMDSKLEVDSIYGEGSDFKFTLRQKVVNNAPMGNVSEKEKPRKRERKIDFTAPMARVLIVDDSAINIRVAKGLLSPTKMIIDTCESGKACLEMCKDTYYDIIFMDHMMPEMDGIEAFKHIRDDETLKSNSSAVVVLTANTVSGSSELYKEVGFDYYLKKPIDVKELNEVVKNLLPEDKVIKIDAV